VAKLRVAKVFNTWVFAVSPLFKRSYVDWWVGRSKCYTEKKLYQTAVQISLKIYGFTDFSRKTASDFNIFSKFFEIAVDAGGLLLYIPSFLSSGKEVVE